MCIRDSIKKEFEFMPGGTIAFGGNPYNAPLNLRAKYTVNGVPLRDLRIGQMCIRDRSKTIRKVFVAFYLGMLLPRKKRIV